VSATIDVLVVGAGPTGLTCASELRRRGLDCRIVDKNDAPTIYSKAIAVHARTLEIFEDLGVAKEAVARGIALTGVTMLAAGKTVVQASFDELDTRYPFVLSIPQAETEAILSDLLQRHGGAVERRTELVGLRESGDSVECTLRHDRGEERVLARYVVGCDGAHSTVRKLSGFSFDGSTYDDQFMLADVRIDWPYSPQRITTFFSESGLLACFPIPGDRFRLIATAPEGSAGGSETPTLEEFQKLVHERSEGAYRLYDPAWMARFRIHCRQVKGYRKGRVFLAGDAAHIHSPAGGQGMNSGIQDAHNLAWKLALVASGAGRPELLDSYEQERHAVGAAVLSSTDFATRVATLRSPLARAVRNRVTAFLSSLEIIQQRLTRNVAELSLTYEKSPIVGEHHASLFSARLGADSAAEEPNLVSWRKFELAPGAGDRAPDANLVLPERNEPVRLFELVDGRFHTLLLFDGRAASEKGYEKLGAIAREVRRRYDAFVKIHVIVPRRDRPPSLAWDGSLLLDPEGDAEDRYGASAECSYLIRPDLYVGFRSQPAEAANLLAYLARIFV
jgi:2-polyprenyl-6-methoxyphenol hydroxylase-like FAD-dependent oxidoreductase